ncbi:MAG: hypothetical protein ACYCWE_21135, partial [Eubacteriales bacterium]
RSVLEDLVLPSCIMSLTRCCHFTSCHPERSAAESKDLVLPSCIMSLTRCCHFTSCHPERSAAKRTPQCS